MQSRPVCCSGDKVLNIFIQVSHDHMCELFTGLVKAKSPCGVHQAAQLLQLLCGQATQIQLQNKCLNQQLLEENSTFHDIDFSFTDLAAIQYIITWAHSKVNIINGIGNLEAADGAVRESCVVDRHAGINRDVAQAQKRRTF